jgi:hypothetical protein
MTAISAITRMNALQIAQLNNSMAASQRVGGLGSRLDNMQYDGAAPVTVGTLVARKYLEYKIAPILGATNTIHATISLTASAQLLYPIVLQPDVPRVLTVTGTNSITTKVKFYGTDFAGTAITDEITMSGTATVLGVRAFKTVSAVDLPAKTTTDSVTLGVAPTKVGMPSIVPYAGYLISALFNGSADSGGSLAVHADLSKNIYTSAGSFNGTLELILVYVA